MPRIAEMKMIDGQPWARVEIDATKEAGSVSLYTPEELEAVEARAFEAGAKAMREACAGACDDAAHEYRDNPSVRQAHFITAGVIRSLPLPTMKEGE